MASQESQVSRPLASFSPSIWGDRFVASSSAFSQAFEVYAQEAQEYKEKTKDMLRATSNDVGQKVSFIDLLCRLGLSYHFEEVIDEQLRRSFEAELKSFDGPEYDLHTVSLVFRVFRQHGYNVSSNVFEKFKDKNGTFTEALKGDTRGLLSLYEATHLRVHGETILDEALAFTTSQLELLATQSSPNLARHITNALMRPLHKGIPRIETWQYISFYEAEDSPNEMLLNFSKKDYNFLQSLYQEELSVISRWYKDLSLASKLPYARDRIVEIYFWTVGAYYEPQYSSARIILAKITSLISLLDDTYDAYGTIEELDYFTHAVERWDASAIEDLPDYMKILFKALLDLYDGLEAEYMKHGTSYSVGFARDTIKELVKGHHMEAKWFGEGYVPTFEEYMGNGLVTSCYHAIIAGAFIGMGEIAGVDAFEWLQTRPKALRASETINRLMDDLVSHKAEQERGHVASGVECYMKQYGASEEEVKEEFEERIRNAWKDVNEECLRPTAVSVHLIMRILNLSRVLDVVYKHGDGYTNPEKFLKQYIIALFVDQIPT